MKKYHHHRSIFIVSLSLGFILIVNGAIPFISMPTLPQAFWTSGFAQSLANQSIFDLHAIDFGNPKPAAMAFGLAGAYPTSLFIRAGIHPADAYTLMVALWITLAFIGAWKISRAFKLSSSLSSLVSILWLSMPIVWWHAVFSMLSLGIGLLPFYLYMSLKIFHCLDNASNISLKFMTLYPIATSVAIFMDGYSFMMFAVGSSIIGIYTYLKTPEQRKVLLTVNFPIHFFSFLFAYVLFSIYVGRSAFGPAPLDFFRGWGADLTFLTAPTQGIHWLWDTLGLSTNRSDREQFGDASVWATTFALPLIVIGSFAWWRIRKDFKVASAFLVLALFGFYMALGPSLKLNSVKPEGVNAPLMKKKYTVMPTGSAVLSKYIPGFYNMRAAYRWSALGFVGFWLLLVLLLSREQATRLRWPIICLILFLIISNLPHIEKKLLRNIEFRNDFFDIENTLVSDLKKDTLVGEQIAFLPFRNDFLVNYLAAKVKIKTYNIGGDKNLSKARKYWPETMKQFKIGVADPYFASRILLLLARDEAETVVLPYIDLLWAAHDWPAPLEFKNEMANVIDDLRRSDLVTIEKREYYALVRMTDALEDKHKLEEKIFELYCMPPYCLEYKGQTATANQVGAYTGSSMNSDGRSGYLMYGPYQPIKSGEYILQVSGRVNSNGDKAHIDVVWNEAKKVYARFDGLADRKEIAGNILLEEKIIFGEDVGALEIRIWVDKKTDLFIDGYSLRPTAQESLEK